ncbi:MAG: tetratricopeptide repeat protein [Bacteroidales bacterium]|nr:tetratricopeptide repeat protein [Bacteroidales bacterium]
MEKWKLPLVFFLTVLFHGCAGIYSVVDFEVLEPATVSFPDGDGHLLVLMRAPISMDAFSEENRTNLDNKQLVILDTLIINSICRGLQEVLEQSPIKRFHTPLWMSERRLDTAYLEDLILTRREVDSWCNIWGGDVLISLEFYSLDLDDSTIYYSDAPMEVQTHYYEVSNKVHWNIYLPGSPRPFDRYTTVDTLFYPTIQNGQFQLAPSYTFMIRDAFFTSGKKYGRYLVPVWSEASRILYKGKGDSLKLASKHTGKGEWDEAFNIWKALLVSEDSTIVAKSLNNMAIFYELEDNLDSASLLVNRALEYDTLEIVRLYRDELDTRIQNRKDVIKQVGEGQGER